MTDVGFSVILISSKENKHTTERGFKMTNYESKKAIFNEMVANGYHMTKERIEEICNDDMFKPEMIDKWRQKFYKWLNEN